MATWKKVLVSGSNIEVGQLTASSGIKFTNAPNFDAGGSGDNVLVFDSDGNLKKVSQSDIAGTDPIIELSGSAGTPQDFNANGGKLLLGSDNGVTINIGNNGQRTTAKISTPQDLQDTATPTFSGINMKTTGDIIESAGGVATITFNNNQLQFNANNNQVHINEDGIIFNRRGFTNQQDVNFTVEGVNDPYLFYIDASSSIGPQDSTHRGQIGIGLHEGGATQLDPNAKLTVSGSIYVKGNITASGKLSGDGSSLLHVSAATAGVAAELTGFVVQDFNNATGSITSLNTFTGSAATYTGTPVANQLAIFTGTDGQIKGDTLHYDTTSKTLSGSLNISASAIAVTGDMHLGGTLNIEGPIIAQSSINTFEGFNFVEGTVTLTSGSTQFGSGNLPSAVTHEFTGSTSVTGSFTVQNLEENNFTNFVVYDTNSGQFHYTASSGIFAGGGAIGTPTDGDYSDGFFSNFTNTTGIGTAIDEISEAFAALAPAKADYLTGENLTLSNATTVTAKLADGLTADHWYNYSKVAGSDVTFTDDADGFTLQPDTDTSGELFHIGKGTDLDAGTLVGGLTASILSQSAPAEYIQRDFNDGNGTENGIGGNTLVVSSHAKFPTDRPVWAAQTAKINVNSLVTGSYRINLSASEALNTNNFTNAFTIWRASGTTDFPDVSSAAIQATLTNETFKYLSGVQYLKSADIAVGLSAQNLYYPVYQEDNVDVSSDYITNFTTQSFSGIPTYNTNEVAITVAREVNLLSNKSSGQSAGTISCTLKKPRKTNVVASSTIGAAPINTWGTRDTIGNSNNLFFLDETYRLQDLNDVGASSTWDSTVSIATGDDLEVQNGRLIHTRFGNNSGNSNNESYYIRNVSPTTNARFSGTLTLTFPSTAFDQAIGPWGSTSTTNNGIQIALIREADITAGSETKVYDLGRSFGGSTTIVGGATVVPALVGSPTLGSGTSKTLNFSLGIDNTGTGDVALYIKYRLDGISSGLGVNDNLTGATLTWTL